MSDVLKISMRGFAEVASAKPSRKQTKLKQYKYPDSDESVGRSNYYIQAISAIKRHHRGESAIVQQKMQSLLAQAAVEKNQRRRAKLLNNHRAISDYLKVFGDRQLAIMPGKRLYYVHKNLVISTVPDLVAEENGHLLLIKFNFCKDDFEGGVCSLMLHVLYEAALLQALPIKSNGVECLQTSSGTRVIGPRSGFPKNQTLSAACQEVLDLWPAA